jgi:hypothetical protein
MENIDDDFKKIVLQRLDDGGKRMDSIEKSMESRFNKQDEALSELLELFQLGKNGLKVLGWLGGGLVWAAKAVAALGAAGGAIYVLWYQFTHGGQLPPTH